MREDDKRKVFSGNRKPHSDSLKRPDVNHELINARLKAGFTQKEMAEKLHISRSMYTLMETNKRSTKNYKSQLESIFA